MSRFGELHLHTASHLDRRISENLSPFAERFKCSEQKKYDPPRIEDKFNLGMNCFSNPSLQPGQPEWKSKQPRLFRSFRVKGRRHILSVLKSTEERIKLEGKTQIVKVSSPLESSMNRPWECELPLQHRPEWNFTRAQSIPEKATLNMIPSPWESSMNWRLPDGNIRETGKTRFMGWDPTLKDTKPKVRQTKQDGKLSKMTKIQSLQPKPCWNVSRGSKGQSSRERGMDRKAMDERNMRERFWRLRERALVDKLHDLLPDSYKSVKVKACDCKARIIA